jgi:hypothetical protein
MQSIRTELRRDDRTFRSNWLVARPADRESAMYSKSTSTLFSHFRHIEPCSESVKFSRYVEKLKADEVVSKARGLAESARCFYVGIYPFEAPYFPWNQIFWLPWAEKYKGSNGATNIPPRALGFNN